MTYADNIVLAAGPPRERGRAHGEACRDRIAELFAAWEEEVGRLVGMPLARYIERFVGETGYLSAMERWTPELLEEVRGIGEGSGVGLERSLALQCMDEHWSHVEALAAQKEAGCSAVAIRRAGSRPTLVGQNLDLPKHLDGFQMVLHVVDRETGHEVLAPSYPGFIGLSGVSNRGLAVCVNSLAQLRSAPTGLPVAAVIRDALDQPSLADAARRLESLPHASGQSYLVGEAEGYLGFECSASGTVRLSPRSGAPFLCHTNHPLESTDLRSEYAGWGVDRARADAEHGRTFTRLAALERTLMATERITLEQVESLLSTTQGYLCRLVDGPFEVFSFCGVVYELGPRLRMRVALGPPALEGFVELGFD